ncbi:MAG: helix-turn-helix domain-containing protein [Clostridia bacterium]|nr:helix-turn-helix domain-containing protein [Clostridia bacterium]
MDQFRITKATMIMKYDKNISINQIAAKVGYPNCSVFSYKFRKMIGISPSEYKNNL